MELVRRLINEEEGQGLVEYALIVGLIAIAAVISIRLAGTSINDIWDNIADTLDGIIT